MNDYNTQSGSVENGESMGVSSQSAVGFKEQIADKATEAKDKVTEFGRKAVDKVDSSRESAAGALDKTAASLHSSGDKLSGVAHSAAGTVEATADYVRRTDLKGMAADVQDIVKRYPGQSLAAATVLGFLVARSLRSHD